VIKVTAKIKTAIRISGFFFVQRDDDTFMTD
jgi:hypothetical protein